MPIIVLTAKGEEVDRVWGLEIGADDCVVKPFSPRELVARAKVALRRQAPPPDKVKVIEARNLRLDAATREVVIRGKDVERSNLGFKLLHFLASHPRRTFARDRLLDEVWGHNRFVTPRTIDAHIRRLREKFEAEPDNPEFVHTVRGAGYGFVSKTSDTATGTGPDS